MIDDKTIRGFTAPEIIEQIMNVAKWLDTFVDAGEAIFGEDFEMVLAVVGLSVAGLVPPMERLGDLGNEYAKKYKEKEAEETVNDFIRKLNIRKEGDDIIPS